MRYVKGDICDAAEEHIVHGCNAQGVMGKGVAKSIRERFKGCFEVYKSVLDSHYRLMCESYGEDCSRDVLLGLDASFYDVETGKTIHNLVTQSDYERDSAQVVEGFALKKYASYLAIIDGLRRMFDHDPSIRTIASSKIGCGLGGLKWSVLSEILIEIEETEHVEFVIYDRV